MEPMARMDEQQERRNSKRPAWMAWLDAAKILAVVLLVIYLPVLIVVALAVVLTSSGPAFVSRCYRRPNGELVDLYEFRTECWQKWEPTPLGRCLRRGNIHRLPALVNVIRGDVGPGERVQTPAA